MATDAVLARLKRLGQGFLQPSAGLAAMQAVAHSMATASPSTAVIAVNPFDWPTYTAAMTPIPHFFNQLAASADTCATAAASVSGQSNAAVASMAGGVPTARAPALSHEVVSAQVQTALKSIIGESISLEEPLMSAGLDSLGSVEFANVLSRRFGMQMPGTLVFDYPTVNAVSAYLHSKLQVLSPNLVDNAQAARVTAAPASMVLPVPLSGDERQGRPTAVAILAAAHPMATASHSSGSSAWDQDHITLVPDARWDADSAAGQKHSMQARFGSFMRDVELFDSAAFGMSMAESISMDPQQRCLLQCTAEVLHGVSSGPSLTIAGVFVGISWTEYAKMASTHRVPVGAYTAQSAVLSVAAGQHIIHSMVCIGCLCSPACMLCSTHFVPSAAAHRMCTSDACAADCTYIDRRIQKPSRCACTMPKTDQATHERAPILACTLVITSRRYCDACAEKPNLLITKVWCIKPLIQTFSLCEFVLQVSAFFSKSASLMCITGRISYHFGFKGPAVAMDTACSSSLVAANAARVCALSHGHALTGGINMMLLPSTTDMFQRAGMLTRDGRCKALDAAADGYVRYIILILVEIWFF